MREIPVTDLKYLKVNGRTGKNTEAVSLFWTASGVEFAVTGSECHVKLFSDYDYYEQWITVKINGAFMMRLMLTKGTQEICLFRTSTPTLVKHVQILKDVQAMSGDPRHLLQVLSIKTDGEEQPLPEKSLRLEFIGDSITSGEGIYGAHEDYDWISCYFGTADHYAIKIAEALDADVRILSQSGWGVNRSWDNNPGCVLPRYYRQVCGLLNGEIHQKLGADDRYDFSSWPCDAVIINLGTNDGGAFDSPAYVDPVTGVVTESRKLPDGSLCREDCDTFIEAVVRFLCELRECNPNAYLIWVYGMLGDRMMVYLQEALDRFCREQNDTKALLVALPEAQGETFGSRGHPGPKCHEQAASVLIPVLQRLLKKS